MKKLLSLLLLSTILAQEDSPVKPKIKLGGGGYGNRVPLRDHNVAVVAESPEENKMKTELHTAAFKVAKYYVDMFEYMDKNIDDKISVDELMDVYEHHHWAKPAKLNIQ